MRAAMRWTAPMKAPCPPPTMPSRIGPSPDSTFLPLTILFLPELCTHRLYTHHCLEKLSVGLACGKVIEGLFRNPDDVAGNERRAFGRAVFGMLEAALPFEDCPGIVAVLRQLGEDAAEINLTVAQGAEASGAVYPTLVAGIDTLASVRVELGILHMERLDPLMVDVDKGEIVQLLQQEMRGIVVYVAALVASERIEKHFEGGTVENVLTWVNLVADIDAMVLVNIEYRLPSPGKLLEGFLDETGRALREWIKIRKGERPGKGNRDVKAQMA